MDLTRILNSQAFAQWIAQSLAIFFLLGGFVVLAVGLGLFFRAEKTLRTFDTLNRWVSMRRTNGTSTPSGLPFRGPALVVEVRDQGAGIPKEIEGRLFEPFNTTKVGGSGLGLVIVHRAIEAHRGVILVDSDASGARFTVLLPLDPSNAGATS